MVSPKLISLLFVIVGVIICSVCMNQYDIIFSTTSREQALQSLGLSHGKAKKLAKYAKNIISAKNDGLNNDIPTPEDALKHIISSKIFNATTINALLQCDTNYTLINSTLSEVWQQIQQNNANAKHEIYSTNHDINAYKSIFKLAAKKSKLLFQWIQQNGSINITSIDRNTAINHLKEAIKHTNITEYIFRRKWNMNNFYWMGHSINSIYDLEFRNWFDELRKNSRKSRKRTINDVNVENSDYLSDALIVSLSGLQPDHVILPETDPVPSQRPRIIPDSVTRDEYLQQFNASQNGPMHEQSWGISKLAKFDTTLSKWDMKECVICKTRRIATTRINITVWA